LFDEGLQILHIASPAFCGHQETVPKYGLGSINDSSNNTSPFLGTIYPNPFSDYTNVPYYLPVNCTNAEIDIFDVLGNKLNVYPLNTKGIKATLRVSSENYSGGVYFCILIVDGSESGWKKLLVIK
jgi:hypothetical protein